MEHLVDHAYQRATQPRSSRPSPQLVTKELALLAGEDREALRRAWDHCVQRYAEEGDLSWLMAATYLLPLVLRSPPRRRGGNQGSPA